MVMQFIRQFKWSLTITLVTLATVLLGLGFAAFITALILIAIEIAFSFDNAIINAKILEKLSVMWQQLFLTIGVVVAIVGMRLIFPIAVVALAAHLPWNTVISLALHHPTQYAKHLEQAHVPLSAFGGGFLLTLAIHFFFDDKRETVWLKRFERPQQQVGGKWWLPTVAALAVVCLAAVVPMNHHVIQTLQLGTIGVLSYATIDLLIKGLSKLVGSPHSQVYTGWAAFVVFIYLQVLDASFSFDGVLGAFAITNQVVLIAIGLGIGAIWVRSLTVYMVKRRVLGSMIYLEHGAHYAILALAWALLLSIFWTIPNVVTGLVGIGIIGAAIIASRQAATSK